MTIDKHRLALPGSSPALFRPTPNTGGALTPEYLVVHFTAGRDAESSIRWLTNPRSRASAHVVIGRDGQVTQLAPFDRVTWHAGESRWHDRFGLNRYAIGIELDNAGRLVERQGRWYSWFGREYPAEEVVEATHKHEREPSGWHAFSEAQIEAAAELANSLVHAYGLGDVLGHDDIAPGRKTDPGPAFPMADFRELVLGLREDDPHVFVTTDLHGEGLNVRCGPGAQFNRSGGPLARGTRVRVLDHSGEWRHVEALEVVGGANDLEGWVHGRFLQPAERASGAMD